MGWGWAAMPSRTWLAPPDRSEMATELLELVLGEDRSQRLHQFTHVSAHLLAKPLLKGFYF